MAPADVGRVWKKDLIIYDVAMVRRPVVATRTEKARICKTDSGKSLRFFELTVFVLDAIWSLYRLKAGNVRGGVIWKGSYFEFRNGYPLAPGGEEAARPHH